MAKYKTLKLDLNKLDDDELEAYLFLKKASGKVKEVKEEEIEEMEIPFPTSTDEETATDED